jgi:cellulose synthase/poly-beta-1,6-N-acetylglucosamine synthase-like glycosyltransferase
MNLIIILFYIIPLTWLFLYSLGQLNLVFLYWTNGKNKSVVLKALTDNDQLPFVTVQLPIYNELYVVENLLDAIGAFDYPLDKFEVQVLDDSTDETVAIISKKVAELTKKGLNIVHISREERTGFKAGALQYGTTLAKGEFIAIFDADFRPYPDFLKRSLPYFKDDKISDKISEKISDKISDKIALVQTRWVHLNENYSLLTRVQAIALNAHFIVEHLARNRSGLFMNFNGTAGIWRKAAIMDAGGWEADTLTEDIDLSYRAQLKGWSFAYVPEIECPAEIPIDMSAMRSQQFRWVKGPAECARKNLGRVFNDKKMSIFQKIHAFYHLLNSSLFIAVFIMSIFSLPLIFTLNNIDSPFLISLNKILSFGIFFIFIFFWTANQHIKGNSIAANLRFLLMFPLLWMMSLGLSMYNSFAAFEGYIGKKTPFIRTPKFNLIKQGESKNNQYISQKLNPFVYFELLLAACFLLGILAAFYWQIYALMPLHIGLFLGYSLISGFSIYHNKRGA